MNIHFAAVGTTQTPSGFSAALGFVRNGYCRDLEKVGQLTWVNDNRIAAIQTQLEVFFMKGLP